MKIKLVSLEDGITSCGFRKIASFISQLNTDTEACYVSTNQYRSLLGSIKGSFGGKGDMGDDAVDEIAQGLAGADLVGY
jgi:anaerobic magnesium-protoporphyrin IX monomethyl ester cyclase